MRRFAPALLILLAAACAGKPDPELADWHLVLARKKAADQAEGTQRTAERQRYVDALRNFCLRYPGHARSREVYEQAELEFARELLARGDYEQASRFYVSVLRDDPGNEDARSELDLALRRRFITPEALAELKKGMRPREVAERIGQPQPGWERTVEKGDRRIVGWYYPRRDGGVGGVYFIDDHLFAAEYDKTIRLK